MTWKNSLKNKMLLITLLVIGLLALDQISKIWVKTHMALYDEIPVFGSWFKILFVENLGAAYGFELGGSWGKLILSLIRIIAVIFLIWYIRKLIVRDRTARMQDEPDKQIKTGIIVGFALILAGAIGNIIDSAFYGMIFSESTPNAVAHFTSWGEGYSSFLHGAVVDMLHFPIIEIEHMPDWIPIWGGGEFTFFSPVFNVADSYVTCGITYLILFHFKFFK